MFEQTAKTNSQFYSTNPAKLWVQAEATRNHPSPHLSFSKEKRFKWSSIYWPDCNDLIHAANKKHTSDICELADKISKRIDDQQKNQARNRQLKRTLTKGHSQLSTPRKESFSGLSTKKPFKLNKLNEAIVSRLTTAQQRYQSSKRDRHGNRCNLYDNPEQEIQMEDTGDLKRMSKTSGFSTSRKVQLSLPHNYFPGPGTYEIKRYLAQLDNKSEFYQTSKAKTERIHV